MASGLPLPEETESARARRARIREERQGAAVSAMEAADTSTFPDGFEPQKVVGERFDMRTRQRHLQVKLLIMMSVWSGCL